MLAEILEQEKQISRVSLSSVLSESQKIITEFKYGMPVYIDKVLKEKWPPGTQPYDQEDMVSLGHCKYGISPQVIECDSHT